VITVKDRIALELGHTLLRAIVAEQRAAIADKETQEPSAEAKPKRKPRSRRA
jgi:hypothetical protein